MGGLGWAPVDALLTRQDEHYMCARASIEDLDALMQVEHAAHHSPWSRAVFEREFTIDFSQVWKLTSSAHKLVAFLVFWRVHDELHILNIAVHPHAQRRGLGAWLIEQLTRAGQAREMTLITLEVRASNTPARALYTRTGFDELGVRPKYYADNGEDAVIMTKLLPATSNTSPP